MTIEPLSADREHALQGLLLEARLEALEVRCSIALRANHRAITDRTECGSPPCKACIRNEILTFRAYQKVLEAYRDQADVYDAHTAG